MGLHLWVRQQNCGRGFPTFPTFPPPHEFARVPSRELGATGVGHRIARAPAAATGNSFVPHRGREIVVRCARVLRPRSMAVQAIIATSEHDADPLAVRVDRHTPQHCSVLSTTRSDRCLHYGARKIILAYRHRGRELTCLQCMHRRGRPRSSNCPDESWRPAPRAVESFGATSTHRRQDFVPRYAAATSQCMWSW
jgi:hypothetical protein